MDELIRQNWRSAQRIAGAEARKWNLASQDHEDVLQEALAATLRYWNLADARDPSVYFLSWVHLNAKSTVMRLMGFPNGKKRQQAAKAAGEQATYSVGLYQPATEGETLLLDERILPFMPSAEDVYMATVPNKRQTALREAIQSLPDRQRDAVTLRFYEDLSIDEVASRLGISHDQAKWAANRGIASLKTKLKGKINA